MQTSGPRGLKPRGPLLFGDIASLPWPIIAAMEERTCNVCGNTYPLDKQHFRWRKDYEAFTAECLACRAKQRIASKKRAELKRGETLRKIEEAGVDLFLGSVHAGGSNIPHTAEVIERVFQYFGGTGGMAAVLVKQYWDAAPGSSARNRLLETICRMVTKNVDAGGAKKPLSLWTEEELEQELNKRFEQALSAFQGRTIDARPTEALPAPEEEAPEGGASAGAEHSDDLGVPARKPQGAAKRTARAEDRGPSTVQGEPATGASPSVPSV